MTFCDQVKKPVTLVALSTWALISKKLLLVFVSLDEKQREDICALQASKYWALALTKCHASQVISFHGEAGSIDATAAVGSIAKISERLKECNPKCVCNIGETELYYKLILRRLYVCTTEKHCSV